MTKLNDRFKHCSSDPLNLNPKSIKSIQIIKDVQVKIFEHQPSKLKVKNDSLNYVIPKMNFSGNEKIIVASHCDPSLMEFAKIKMNKNALDDLFGSDAQPSSATIINPNPARIPSPKKKILDIKEKEKQILECLSSNLSLKKKCKKQSPKRKGSKKQLSNKVSSGDCRIILIN